MPLQSRPNPLARLSDNVLGIFALVPESKNLDHTIRFLIYSYVIQYIAKLLIPILEFRARLRHDAGLITSSKSAGAEKLAKLSSIISDSRTLWRIWGLLPIFQWLISLERTPPQSRFLQTIERLQGFSMLIYYPLEHIYYFASHGILPSRLTPSSRLNNRIAIWSCRAWAAYVVLQFLHLKEDHRLLKLQEDSVKHSIKIGSGTKDLDPNTISEEIIISRRKTALWNEFLVNVGYLPLTIHWYVFYMYGSTRSPSNRVLNVQPTNTVHPI
ncbi:hypothetical protein Clacol_002554 [Clathrus columnatus]|uniref:Uncharacterized protein n=1 Tax=Clathrus columnatus TaxID=1419009 RepID=A0AAV5A4F3_9AGAM|nr:hypothetical protein Clacol_002554 [Clathrus columnatus]